MKSSFIILTTLHSMLHGLTRYSLSFKSLWSVRFGDVFERSLLCSSYFCGNHGIFSLELTAVQLQDQLKYSFYQAKKQIFTAIFF